MSNDSLIAENGCEDEKIDWWNVMMEDILRREYHEIIRFNLMSTFLDF